MSFVNKGTDWDRHMVVSYMLHARLQYLTLPLMLRLEVPNEGKPGAVRPYLRAGIGVDLLLWKGGEWGDGRDLATESTFYNGHRGYNLSFLWGFGFDVGIFENPSLLVGIDLLFDDHLLGEFVGSDWKYANAYFGVHLTYQVFATRP